jgi:uncharacterized coiled-coil DUF342 family protein
MDSRVKEYEKRKSEYCDKIEELAQKLEQLRKERRDTTQICNQLETVLKAFLLFKRGGK